MPTTWDIQFEDHPEKVFVSGERLRCIVTLSLTSPKNIRGVYLVIHGCAETNWTKSRTVRRNGKRRTVLDSYSAYELYMDEKVYFVGGANGENF